MSNWNQQLSGSFDWFGLNPTWFLSQTGALQFSAVEITGFFSVRWSDAKGSQDGILKVESQPNFDLIMISQYIDVSKNRGTPKWMVYDGKPY